MGSENTNIVNTLEIVSGEGLLRFDGKGDLVVGYQLGSSSSPKLMVYSDGGANQGPLPLGDSEYEVTDAFQINYEMGDSTVKLTWEWLPS